jgi:hypothetical protein
MLDQDSTYILVALFSVWLIGFGKDLGVVAGLVIFTANLFAYTWSKKGQDK